MILHSELEKIQLWRLIHQEKIKLAGNRRLKIFGTLSCKSGKKMKKKNRVFFYSEFEAVCYGFRPCGHCLTTKYQKWKHNKQPARVVERLRS